MIEKINKTEELVEKLNREGQTHPIESSDYMRSLNRMNEEMEAVKREFKVKDEISRASAAGLVLTS